MDEPKTMIDQQAQQIDKLARETLTRAMEAVGDRQIKMMVITIGYGDGREVAEFGIGDCEWSIARLETLKAKLLLGLLEREEMRKMSAAERNQPLVRVC